MFYHTRSTYNGEPNVIPNFLNHYLLTHQNIVTASSKCAIASDRDKALHVYSFVL